MVDVTALGEVLIDFTPLGYSDSGNPIYEQNPGGAPANVLVALSRMGIRTEFIGKIGNDPFGRSIRDVLEQCGVGTTGLAVGEEAVTTLAFVHLDENGDRSFSFCRKPGADILLRPEEVNDELIRSSKIFHCGSVSMTDEPVRLATLSALECARKHGVLISLDPNLRKPLWRDLEQARETIKTMLSYADVVKLSEEELAFVTGTSDLEAGSRLVCESFHVPLLFVTLGSRGSFYRFGQATGQVPGYHTPVVDTTGAGDAFTGAMLYQILLKGGRLAELTETDLHEMVAFANAAGAAAVAKRGAIPAMPSIDDIRKVMRTFEQEAKRPQYHFTPPKMWMNDPNGMVYYEGEYHLFYQHHPGSCDWGPMHWGHAVSRDLIHWEHLPIALKPDHNGFIFSGCAVADWRDHTGFFNGGSGLVAIFTHSSEDAASGRARQAQSLAYSTDNGRTWMMYEGNPVLVDETFVDFRDPKVFYHAATSSWIMVLAAGDRVRLYRSPNLVEWAFASEFGAGEGCHEGVWECPDLFELKVDGKEDDTRWVLIVSLNPASPAGSGTQYFIGHFDGYRFVNDHDPELVLWLDHGRDNYAGVTWSNTDRPLEGMFFVGWMSNWIYAHATPTDMEEWRGAMTLPRRLSLREEPEGVRLYQEPVAQLDRLRERVYGVQELRVGPADNPLAGVKGELLEIDALLELEDAHEVGIKVRVSGENETVIGYDADNQVLYFDRRKSGNVEFHESFPSRNEVPLPLKNRQIQLRIFVDRSSVEVFANGGKVVMSNLIFPDVQSNSLELFAVGGHVKAVSLDVYAMKSIYQAQETAIAECDGWKVG